MSTGDDSPLRLARSLQRAGRVISGQKG